MSKSDDTADGSEELQINVTTSADDDTRRPPGSGGAAAGVSDDEDENGDDVVFASDIQPNPVNRALGGTRHDRDEYDFELDDDQPWKTTDRTARLERAKDQAETLRVRSNYGTVV